MIVDKWFGEYRLRCTQGDAQKTDQENCRNNIDQYDLLLTPSYFHIIHFQQYYFKMSDRFCECDQTAGICAENRDDDRASTAAGVNRGCRRSFANFFLHNL
jgi:hypothetical protein